MKTPDPRIAAQLDEIVAWLAEPLLIDPEWLTRMFAANASSRREVEGFFFLFDEKAPLKYTMDNGVARLPISGPLARKSAYRVTYEEIAGQVEKAAKDDRVRAILLDVDSPGGVVSGMYEAADAIKAAKARKPVAALANDYMTSAAYGLVSGASKIYSTRYGTTGSIGVVLMHTDYSKMNERVGITPTLIFAGRKKAWGNPEMPLSDEARADLQKLVDHHYDGFVKLIAENRGLHVHQVRGQEAGTFMPADAEREGLVDGVRTFDECAHALSAEGATMAERTDAPEPKGEIVDLEEAREKARAEGRREAAERSAKITMLCKLNRKPELAGEFIASEKTPDQVGEALLELAAKDDEKIRVSGTHGTGFGGKPAKTITQKMIEQLEAKGMKPRPDTLSAYVPQGTE